MSLLIRNVRAIDPSSGLDGLRNILLDDVAKDIKIIDGLINASDYVRAHAASLRLDDYRDIPF